MNEQTKKLDELYAFLRQYNPNETILRFYIEDIMNGKDISLEDLTTLLHGNNIAAQEALDKIHEIQKDLNLNKNTRLETPTIDYVLELASFEQQYGLDHTVCLKMLSEIKRNGVISNESKEMLWSNGKIQEKIFGSEEWTEEEKETLKQEFFTALEKGLQKDFSEIFTSVVAKREQLLQEKQDAKANAEKEEWAKKTAFGYVVAYAEQLNQTLTNLSSGKASDELLENLNIYLKGLERNYQYVQNAYPESLHAFFDKYIKKEDIEDMIEEGNKVFYDHYQKTLHESMNKVLATVAALSKNEKYVSILKPSMDILKEHYKKVGLEDVYQQIVEQAKNDPSLTLSDLLKNIDLAGENYEELANQTGIEAEHLNNVIIALASFGQNIASTIKNLQEQMKQEESIKNVTSATKKVQVEKEKPEQSESMAKGTVSPALRDEVESVLAEVIDPTIDFNSEKYKEFMANCAQSKVIMESQKSNKIALKDSWVNKIRIFKRKKAKKLATAYNSLTSSLENTKLEWQYLENYAKTFGLTEEQEEKAKQVASVMEAANRKKASYLTEMINVKKYFTDDISVEMQQVVVEADALKKIKLPEKAVDALKKEGTKDLTSSYKKQKNEIDSLEAPELLQKANRLFNSLDHLGTIIKNAENKRTEAVLDAMSYFNVLDEKNKDAKNSEEYQKLELGVKDIVDKLKEEKDKDTLHSLDEEVDKRVEKYQELSVTDLEEKIKDATRSFRENSDIVEKTGKTLEESEELCRYANLKWINKVSENNFKDVTSSEKEMFNAMKAFDTKVSEYAELKDSEHKLDFYPELEEVKEDQDTVVFKTDSATFTIKNADVKDDSDEKSNSNIDPKKEVLFTAGYPVEKMSQKEIDIVYEQLMTLIKNLRNIENEYTEEKGRTR